jgi:hypothetical protein
MVLDWPDRRIPAKINRLGAVWSIGAGSAALALLCGCGIAASPQPPSLNLPKPVHDLTAARSGPSIDLRWTAPSQTTDHTSLTKPVPMRVCRQAGSSPCQTVGTVRVAPGKPASFRDTLPAALQTGPLRAAAYRVYALSPKGRDAGPSNAAPAAIGAAPSTLHALTASVARQGVVLHWAPDAAKPAAAIRLERTLILPAKTAKTKSKQGLPAAEQPVTVLLNVPPGPDGKDPGQVLDTGVQFGSTYRYIGYRIAAAPKTHPPLVASSARSTSVTITPQDIFPPAAPTGLVAIPLAAAVNQGHAAVDLSWLPVTAADFAGYRVYRREIAPEPSASVQIAPAGGAPPLLAPAFHDAAVAPGATYAYRVTTVNTTGVESALSAEVQTTVPADDPTPVR